MRKKSNRNKVIVVIVLICFIIVFLLIGLYKKNVKDKSIKEVLEYLECKYIDITPSKEDGYYDDIYIRIPYKAVDIDGVSNQYYYEKLIKYISPIIKKEKYRIIDEEQDLIIRVQYSNKHASYTINGDSNFYESEKKRIAYNNESNKNKAKTKTSIQLEIKSNVLNNIIENDWRRAVIKNQLGTIDENDGEYDCYIDEGYEIKTNNLKIFNIVFKQNYKKEVFDGIYTGANNQDLIKEIGQPDFIPEDNIDTIGYKTDNYYVFFSNGEISIYRKEKLDEAKNKEFSKLVTELNNNKNYNDFFNKTIELYPDYDKFTRNNDSLEISYILKGFKIKHNEIIIYNNYEGFINNDTRIEDIKDGKQMPNFITTANIDGIFLNEIERTMK